MDKLYDIIIDRSSTTITVLAKDEDDAAKKGMEFFRENHMMDSFEFWVGDVDEQETWEEE